MDFVTLVHILWNKKIYYRFSECHLSVTINKSVSLKLSVVKVIPKPFMY